MDAPLATVLVALIGAFIALTVAWRTNFVAEDFRRFRDGSALAAALLGELRAYEPALPMLKRTLRSWIAAVDNRTSAALTFRPFEVPVDPVFTSGIEKLGLLGPDLAENVSYVYANIRAFRVGMRIITSKPDPCMGPAELKQRCLLCLEALERASSRGDELVAALDTRAKRQYRPPAFWNPWASLA